MGLKGRFMPAQRVRPMYRPQWLLTKQGPFYMLVPSPAMTTHVVMSAFGKCAMILVPESTRLAGGFLWGHPCGWSLLWCNDVRPTTPVLSICHVRSGQGCPEVHSPPPCTRWPGTAHIMWWIFQNLQSMYCTG